MSNYLQDATKKLFDERENFIIIGLTGRTGAGCTTVAHLLNKTFKELSPPRPKNSGYHNNEERKYKIVYEYSKEHWDAFTVIEMRNIITSFILANDYEAFINSFDVLRNGDRIITGYEEFVQDAVENLKPKYDEVFELRLKISEIFDREGDNALSNDDVYDYYFNRLGELTKIIQSVLKKYQLTITGQPSANLYTYFYQLIANNVRASGNAFSDTFNPEKIFIMPQRTNLMIKILRKRNLNLRNRVLVVIDALRNPFEVSFFKDRYAAFYLFAVNTDNKDRISRLYTLGYNIEQIENLDQKEYPEKLSGANKFTSQNIQKCIELADIYIYNPNIGTANYKKLKEQLIRYISLIIHPGIITPTAEERCMQIAFNAKANSGCLSRQVGATITDENYSIKSIGWNSSPEGQTPCNLRDLLSTETKDDEDAFSNFELNDEKYATFIKNEICIHIGKNRKMLKGRLYPYCFKDMYNKFENKKNQVHTRALHAEENAFLQIAKNGGMPLIGGYLFSTASPCELCSKKAYQIGIKKIYYIDPYPGISFDHIISCGKIKPEMILFNGAIGRAYTQLYTLILPYKDELEMLVSDD